MRQASTSMASAAKRAASASTGGRRSAWPSSSAETPSPEFVAGRELLLELHAAGLDDPRDGAVVGAGDDELGRLPAPEALEDLLGERLVGADVASDLLAEAPDELGLVVERVDVAVGGGADLVLLHADRAADVFVLKALIVRAGGARDGEDRDLAQPRIELRLEQDRPAELQERAQRGGRAGSPPPGVPARQ